MARKNWWEGVKSFLSRDGKTVMLPTPAQKAGKYAQELKTRTRHTYGNIPKVDKDTKEPIKLTDTQSAYRSGYLDARKDNEKAFKHNWKKKYGVDYPNSPSKKTTSKSTKKKQ